DMKEVSSAVLNLRPVTFSYKSDASHAQQVGLIAEEVQKVMPALVVRGADGQVETVKYHDLAVLLLNELIKQHAVIEKQNKVIANKICTSDDDCCVTSTCNLHQIERSLHHIRHRLKKCCHELDESIKKCCKKTNKNIDTCCDRLENDITTCCDRLENDITV